ncbi:MAG: metallophosphoesterase [Pirellulales bacterium]|nr:metallophosphoesterase [Pirellulales bacterium]
MSTTLPPRFMTRRRFLIGAGIAGTGSLALGGYTFAVEPHWIDFVERPLPVERLPKELVGKKLVQISDLHIGPIVDEGYISRAIERVSDIEPDILVVTGDWMTCRYDESLDQAKRVLSHLRPAKLATLGILGNHDYGAGWRQNTVADRFSGIAADAGVTILRNEVREVEGLSVVGMDDLWSENINPREALETVEDGRASIVLCHNPDTADLPVWSDYRGWILCGHTHGGQCKPPWFRPPILPVRNRRYDRGEIELTGGRKMYINPGLGYLRRVRFNVRPEVTVFTLQASEPA